MLVLLRHGESEGNASGLFTGRQDAALTDLGRAQSLAAGIMLAAKFPRLDVAFTSTLQRARHTCALVLQAMERTDVQIEENDALDERDYGQLTGLSKAQAIRRWGAEHVQAWRRSYDVAPPGGESLRETKARAWPYYLKAIQPLVLSGASVLVVAHGNSLRALMLDIEGIEPASIVLREVPHCSPIAYQLSDTARLDRKYLVGKDVI